MGSAYWGFSGGAASEVRRFKRRIAKVDGCENLWFCRQDLLVFREVDEGVGWLGAEFAMEQESCLCSNCGRVQNWRCRAVHGRRRQILLGYWESLALCF